MAQENIHVVPSHPLTKGAVWNNFSTTPISHPLPTTTEPAQAETATFGETGSWEAGKTGETTAERLRVMPYAEGEPGSLFWVRLYGWQRFGAVGGPQTVWMPTLLVQFACVVGTLGGPSLMGAGNPFNLGPMEYLAGEMAVITGGVGGEGKVRSPGIDSGFPAWALVELDGAQKFQFGFQAPEDNVIGMNAFWARA